MIDRMRRFTVAVLLILTLSATAACTVAEVQYVTGLAGAVIDYKLHGGGWR